MDLLLDTQALLWWLDGDPDLSAPARQAIGDPGNAVLVSTASAWEIATKVRIGKLPGAAYVAGRRALDRQGRFGGPDRPEPAAATAPLAPPPGHAYERRRSDRP